jgi:hypothetical protein
LVVDSSSHLRQQKNSVLGQLTVWKITFESIETDVISPNGPVGS